jgi:integrase
MAGSSLKKMRKKWGVYLDLPGYPKRINQPLGLELDQKQLAKTENKKINGWIATQNWAELHAKFPDCEEIRSFLPAGTGLSMDALFDAMVEDWKVKGRRSLEDMLSKHQEVRAFFKPYLVSDVLARPALIEEFISSLKKRGLGPASIQRKFAQVKRAFNFAFEKRKIKELPPFPDDMVEPEPRQTRFTEAEVDRLVEKLPERLKRAALVASICGWRLNAVLSRKIRTHIDWEGGVLILDAASSKNGETLQFPLTPKLRAVLKEQIDFVEQLERKHGMVIQWLFPNDDARHQIGDRMKRFDDVWHRACDEAGLNTDPETGKPAEQRRWYHDFRRTAQDHLEEMGLADTQIMELVGHKTLSMRKRYRKLFDRKRVVGIGDRLAAAEAEVAAARAGKVVQLVQHVCNTAPAEKTGNAVALKSAVNSRDIRWAGSESNTRHKDFQS